MSALALNPLDAQAMITAFGTVGVAVILFAETGLLIGFFLPGDSLLFTAGLLCTTTATGTTPLSLPWVLLAAVAGALIGAPTGFVIGRRGGRLLLDRTGNRQLHRGMARAEELLTRYGHGKAIVLARFVPVVRTVLNPMAGALGVPARAFALWQILGGLLWTVGLIIAGFLLGSTIPGVDRYLLPVVCLIVVVSAVPVALELRRARRA
ncbi:membrane-associated protein [Actinocorallia herbida]|uniref:Membrane-associated protein n=1 Tax=Actinocorallia herbida TaxID=58109 RepID=A0A3N1D1Y0_9ACTN|nr:DedA family protein [Actinocorallia herbida]ROO87549.1 membrane-associated protein [Actinocorallia herbida]